MAGIRRHVSKAQPAGCAPLCTAAAATMPDVADGRSSRYCLVQRSLRAKPF